MNKKYRLKILLGTILLMFSIPLQAENSELIQYATANVQQSPKRYRNAYKKLDAQKLQVELSDFITEYAQLSSNEARDFFPVYFSMKDKVRNIERKKSKILRLNATSNRNVNDSKRAINEICQLEKKSSKIEIEYIQRCSKIIGPQKFFKVMLAERKFNKKVFKDMMKIHRK